MPKTLESVRTVPSRWVRTRIALVRFAPRIVASLRKVTSDRFVAATCAPLILQRGFEMWCHAAHQSGMEGGQRDGPDRDHAQDGLGDARYCAPGGGVARLSRHLQPVVATACTTGSGALLSPGVAGDVAAQVDRAAGAGGGRGRPPGRTGHAVLSQGRAVARCAAVAPALASSGNGPGGRRGGAEG